MIGLMLMAKASWLALSLAGLLFAGLGVQFLNSPERFRAFCDQIQAENPSEWGVEGAVRVMCLIFIAAGLVVAMVCIWCAVR